MASYFVETTADRWDALCGVGDGLDGGLARQIEYPMPNKESPTEEGTRASTSLGTNTDQKQNTVVTPSTW
jgi:hypothetical protein